MAINMVRIIHVPRIDLKFLARVSEFIENPVPENENARRFVDLGRKIMN